ncbi:MAG: hypothetical protein M9962_09555 [Oligoflexia bacterium]|nr:hypothetical protein [Oligoflexia bacterium]
MYTNSNPGLDLNFGYFFNERYAVKLGFKHSIFGFNAMPVGAVDVSFLKFDSSIQYFLFPSALVNRTRSFDLYLNAGVSWVERKQTHISYNEVLKDNALGMQGGLGVSYFLIPQSLSLNAEGLVGEVFFKDRDSEVFLPAGIPNTSGGFRSASLGLKYYF